MSEFFKFDGPFFRYGTMLADLIILSVIAVIISIPVITVGIVAAALYYVTFRMITKTEGYITRDFFRGFKENFKQGLIVTLFLGLFYFLVKFNITYFIDTGRGNSPYVWFQIIVAVEFGISAIYIFPIMAKFKMSLFELFKMAFFMANRHFFTTITCVFLLASVVVLCALISPICIFVAPAAYAYTTSFMILRILKKYSPELKDVYISAP